MAIVGKKIKISKIQQQILLAVLGTSLIFGVSLVFIIFLFKYIKFNVTVISEKDAAIKSYYSAIKNVGICKDKNNDGRFTDKDLKECQPNEINVADIPNTLRHNVLIGMAENTALESVARDSLKSCFDSSGKKIDFSKLYLESKTDEERAQRFYMLKVCSSLRAIPDSLPANKNVAALLASINQIFLLSGFQPESLAPSSAGEVSPIKGIEVIPITLSIEKDIRQTTKVLENLERSIRMLSINSATISWHGNEKGNTILKLNAQAQAFYTKQVEATETTKTVYASKEARRVHSNAGSKNNAIKTVDDVVDQAKEGRKK